MGLILYNDTMSNPEKINKKMIFKLWLHCCRRSNAIPVAKFIEFQPHAKEQIEFYEKFVDDEGRTTRNMEEFMAYRKLKA